MCIRTAIAVIALAGGGMSGASGAPEAPTRVVNGGFEAPGHPDTPLTGWSPYDARNVQLVGAEPGPVRSGRRAARLDAAISGESGMALLQPVDRLVPGRRYEVEMWAAARIGATSPAVQRSGLRLAIRPERYHAPVAQSVLRTSTDGWERAHATFTAPRDGEVWIAIEFEGVLSGVAHVDDVSIRRIDEEDE